MGKLVSHFDWEVYQSVFKAAMNLFELTKTFPAEEPYSLTDQIRRSSRSVCANLAEAWRKRRYEAMFLSKLTDAEGAASETQTWLAFPSVASTWIAFAVKSFTSPIESILRMIVSMKSRSEQWIIHPKKE